MTSVAETEIRTIISNWEQAVRDEDMVGIRARHAEDILMFDVPPPLLSRGLDDYMETWKTFYPSQARPITFGFEQVGEEASWTPNAFGDALTGVKNGSGRTVMLKAPKGIWGMIVDKLDWQIFPLQRRVVLPPQPQDSTRSEK